jgi:hypothetical protein
MTYRTFTTLFAVAFAFLLAPVRADDTSSNVTLKSKDGQVQLVMPDGWIMQPSSNPSAALEARNEDGNAFVMVLVVNRDDPYLPLADYAKERRDEVLSHLVNSKFTGPEELQISGGKALQYELHGTSAGSKIDFAYFLTVAQMKHHYVEVVSWTAERHFSEFSGALKAAAKNVTYSGEQ